MLYHRTYLGGGYWNLAAAVFLLIYYIYYMVQIIFKNNYHRQKKGYCLSDDIFWCIVTCTFLIHIYFKGCSTNTFVINQLPDWSFVEISSKHCLSQTIRARELKFWENIHPSPRVTCHVSRVLFLLIVSSFFGQSWGASWWRVCYQRGLPRLVLIILN